MEGKVVLQLIYTNLITLFFKDRLGNTPLFLFSTFTVKNLLQTRANNGFGGRSQDGAT